MKNHRKHEAYHFLSPKTLGNFHQELKLVVLIPPLKNITNFDLSRAADHRERSLLHTLRTNVNYYLTHENKIVTLFYV